MQSGIDPFFALLPAYFVQHIGLGFPPFGFTLRLRYLLGIKRVSYLARTVKVGDHTVNTDLQITQQTSQVGEVPKPFGHHGLPELAEGPNNEVLNFFAAGIKAGVFPDPSSHLRLILEVNAIPGLIPTLECPLKQFETIPRIVRLVLEK